MKYVQSYTEFLNESATPGEWVTFVEYEKKGKELKGTHKSHRAAKMAMKKLERSIEGDDTVEGWGMMSKREWDKTEAPFLKESFNIKKVLRKIGWAGEDWTPREFKSQIRKLDDKTLLDWDKSNKGLPNTPLEFQQKLIKSEIERRGLNESVDLNESSKNAINIIKNKGIKDTIKQDIINSVKQSLKDQKIDYSKLSDQDLLQIAVELNEAVTKVKVGDLVAHDKTGERYKVISVPSKTKIIGKNRKGEEKQLSTHHVTMIEVETNESLNEASNKVEDILRKLHFETDAKEAAKMIETLRKIAGWSKDDALYSLKRFRKSIGEEDLGDGLYPEAKAKADRDAAEAAKQRAKEEKELERKRKQAAQWNKRKYDRWIKDSASNGGADNAYDMAQNAKWEPGLLDYVRRNLVYTETPLQRIQWDIEMYS